MVLLFGSPHFDVRNDVHAAREADTAVSVDAADVGKGIGHDGQGLEVALQGSEAVL